MSTANFFHREHKEVAKDLLGRQAQLGRHTFSILGAKGFPTEENGGLYAPVTKMEPGGIYCPRFHNHPLLLIACLSGGAIGGCVLIQSVELSNGRLITKPGLAAEAIGLDGHGLEGTTLEQDGDLVFHLNGIPTVKPAKPVQARPAPTGNVNDAEVQKRMKKIIEVYLKRRKTDDTLTFQGFLNACYACATPRALGMMLNE